MRKLVVCALLGLAACGRAIDPNDPSAMISPMMLEPPPIYSLLGYRTQLRLTSEQVVALDSLAQAVVDQNDAEVAALRARAQESSRSRGMIPLTDEVRPMVDLVRERNRLATLQVQEVLTAEQEAQVCRLYEPTRAERNRRGRAEDTRARGRRGAVPDSLRFSARRPWPWCSATQPADSVVG